MLNAGKKVWAGVEPGGLGVRPVGVGVDAVEAFVGAVFIEGPK